MTGPTPHEALARLACAFPREKIPLPTVGVYVDALRDLAPDVLAGAIEELIRTSEFFPTIRAIRATAAERVLALPDESSALAQIQARLEWARRAEESRPPEPPPVHELVLEAVRTVGGFVAFRIADEPAVIRGQFNRIYKELRGHQLREAALGRLELGRAET